MEIPRGPGAGRRVERVVFVCHANHCRSPMMELLLRAALEGSPEPRTPLLVSSAGTHARPDVPAHPYAVQALAERGIDATAWRSTRLEVADVERADLVLTAAAEQHRDVLAMTPAAQGRTFTLLDFSAWLAAAPSPPDGAERHLLARAAAGRDRSPARSRERDLPDPMGRGLRHFRRCRRRVEAALVPLLAASAQ